MTIKPGIKDALWMAAGAAMLLIVILIVWHFHQEKNPAEQLAFKARRVDLVGRMQLALASAAEAEKSAVLAITDQDSQTFADQARTATAEVERERQEIGELLKAGGTPGEKDLLAQFSQVFTEFQRIDNDLLSLAVKNTNLKAYNLAFGQAADTLKEMNASLSRLVAANADSPEAKKVMLLAFGAQIGALRIQILLPPHIAEESNRKMDELEALMATEDKTGPQGSGRPGLAPQTQRGCRSREGHITLHPVQHNQGPDPGALTREHQRPVTGYLPEPEAQGDASLPKRPVCPAAGHPGGAYCGRDLWPPGQTSLTESAASASQGRITGI